jgi:predicted DCC family thiol-disulfide oxidoreductase YuxK
MNERHYTIVRWCLGVYLLVHFVTLMPHAGELFSGQGALPDPTILPSHGFFPNPLFILSSPQSIQLFLGTMTLVAMLFSAGICTRLSAGALWFGWASLVSRNPFISNPSIPFVGLLLIFFAFISNKKKDAQLLAWRGIWVIMAVAYTVSGLHKLGSPSWVDGSALAELLRNPLARDTNVTHLLGYLSPFILRVLTWGALVLEIAFAPLAVFATTRFYAWALMVMMHLGILLVVAFADLTVGMLILHLFTFDPRWLRPQAILPEQARPVIFYDGSCGMCNRFVQLVLRYDSTKRFDFASLQGEYAQQALPTHLLQNLSTVVLREGDGATHIRSDAILRICDGVGGGWKLLGILRALPRPLRDVGYSIIATYRHKIFPPHDVCGVLTAEDRSRFL